MSLSHRSACGRIVSISCAVRRAWRAGRVSLAHPDGSSHLTDPGNSIVTVRVVQPFLAVLISAAPTAATGAGHHPDAVHVTPSIRQTAQGAPPRTPEQLGAAFRRAYEARDVRALLSLFYLARVDSFTRASLERNLAIDVAAEHDIDSVVVRDPDPDGIYRYTLRGVTYEPSLPVVKELEVYFRKNATGVTSDGFKVGVLNGVYYLASAAPVERPTPAPSLTHEYVNARYGVSLRYSDEYRVLEGIDGRLFNGTDLTFNKAVPIATLVYTAPRFTATSYAGAGIAIWKVQPPSSLGCRTLGPPRRNDSTGVTFYEGAGAATNGTLAKKDSFYLVAHGGDCYKLDARVAVERPSAKTPLPAQDKVDLLDLMDAVSRTFRFTR